MLAGVNICGLCLCSTLGVCSEMTFPQVNANFAVGWTFPWAVTAVRGTHYCLRNVDCGQIWGLLKKESITHFNASPAVSKQLRAHPSAEPLPDSVHVSVAGSLPTLRLFESMTKLNLQPVHIYGLTETYGPVTKGYFMPACNTIPAED